MIKNKIDLQQRFKEEVCSFEIAKKIKKAGMTCANTFFSYDEQGRLGDGAWMEDADKIREKFGLKDFKAPVMYPAIMFPFAVFMMDDTDIEWGKVDFYEYGGKYFLKYNSDTYQSDNIVDVLLMAWIEHKTKK